MASIRARLAVALSEQLLVFATGGWVTAEIDGRIYNAGGSFRESYGQRQHGWTAGAGIEYALNNNWVTRIEYRHSDFGSQHYDALLPQNSFNFDLSVNEIRGGIAYKF